MTTVPRDQLEPLHPDALGWALCCCGWQREEAEDVLAAVLLLALIGGWVRRAVAPLGGGPQPSLAEWRAPTDFLLDTSNRELFVGQPKLGTIHPLPFAERSTAP